MRTAGLVTVRCTGLCGGPPELRLWSAWSWRSTAGTEPALAFPIGAVVWVAVLVLARAGLRADEPRVARRAHVYAAVGVGGDSRDHRVERRARVAARADQSRRRFLREHRALDRAGRLSRRQAPSRSVRAEPDCRVRFVRRLPDARRHAAVPVRAPAARGAWPRRSRSRATSGCSTRPRCSAGSRCSRSSCSRGGSSADRCSRSSAMLALAFIIPQVSFSRDSYSEIPSQILLFTALWLLVTPRLMRDWRVALDSRVCSSARSKRRGSTRSCSSSGCPSLLRGGVVARQEPEASATAHSVAIGAFVAGVVPGMVHRARRSHPSQRAVLLGRWRTT